MPEYALLLCDREFLNHFTSEFLEKFELVEWDPSMGKKNYLEKTNENVFDAIFIDQSLKYTRNHLLAWQYTLKDDGYLLLHANQQQDIYYWLEQFQPRFRLVLQNNANIWVLQKMALPNSFMEYYQYAREIDENTNIRDELRLGQLAELSDPRQFLGTAIMHKCYVQLGMYNKAEDIIKDFADRMPDQNLSAKIFYSLYIIGLGDYQKGFTLRESYMAKLPMLRRTPTPPPEHVQHKKWIGQHLADKTLVVWTEFGLGDEIMFAQLAYYLKTRGVKKLIFVVQDPIVSLIETHPDIDEVVPSSQLETLSGDSYDYWVFPHAIPMFMQEPFQLIPKRHPYLSVSKKEVQEKTALFPNTDRLKVGIVWRGDPSHENDYFRSVHELNYIEDLLQTENVDWYCIQKNCNEEEIALLHKYNVPHITKDFNFMETAAALKHLDYLITVDTSVAHVAGALNVPTLLMLSYVSDWRWGYFNEKTNLWYPSISSYYNSSPSANWSNVIKQLKIDLTKFSKRE